jgi:membrane associated rhomboid family serine protease
MIILPIGHDKLLRRLPYLTITLISLNVLVWLITYPLELHQRKKINALGQELMEEENKFIPKYIEKHPRSVSEPDFRERFEESLKDGELIPKDSEEYKDWQEIHTKFNRALRSRVFYKLGFKTKHLSFLNLISSIFMHGSFFHILFNMLFLWLIGVNIEDYWGRPIFLALFIVGGIFSCIFYTIFNLNSDIPLIGASGAISALMGAFAVRFYNTKIRYFYFFLILLRPIWGTFRLYAWFALGFWFAEQVFYAMISRGAFTGVAFFAHVGGFIFGVAAGFAMKYLKVEEKYLEGKIEKQIESVELHPKLEEAFTKKDSGDIAGAVILLQEVISEEPSNQDARLELARSLFILNKTKESAIQYERLLTKFYENGKMDELYNLYLETYERKLDHLFSPKNLFRIGAYLVSLEEYRKAVDIFSLISKNYPMDKLAPLSLLKMGKIFLNHLGNRTLGRGALTFLIKNYPYYRNIDEAKTILRKSRDY